MFRISAKFPFIIVALSFLAAFVTGLVAYQHSSNELQQAAERQLTALVETRKSNLESFLKSISAEITLLARSGFTNKALINFNEGWKDLGKRPDNYLAKHYIGDNHLQQKEKLDNPKDGSKYSSWHAQYQPEFRKTLRAFGYHDIFLISLSGNLIYSVIKENDFATNLDAGVWQDTNLAKAFKKAINPATNNALVLEDFAKYLPSNEIPAAFMATSVLDKNKNPIGVFAIQLPIQRINELMQVTAGMGKTGETYIVGSDFLMRSDSRFEKNSTILKTKVSTVSVKKALANEAGVHIINDYRGVSVLSAYIPFDFLGTKWAIIAEIDEDEVFAPIQEMQNFMLIAGIVIGIIIAVLGVIFARHLSQPIQSIAIATQRLANDEMETEVPSKMRADEIGDLARAVQTFKDRAQVGAEMEKTLEKKEAQLQETLNNMSEGLLLIGSDLKIEVFNDKVEQLLELPPNFLTTNTPIAKILEFQAERGDFGEGDIAQLVTEKLNDRTEHSIEERLNGKVLDLYRHFTPEGVVVIFNDITAERNATVTLNQKVEELELFNNMAVGRELKMIELKRQINQLLEEKGSKARYEEVDSL
ncbi:MAG: HAMP domain-containing protein [Rhodospirillaceae bacterium]|jgi:methyl-accepting chemotaxis protein|nr:HAMP domain-containing protein [Rhodospirillaceae bacterium]